METPALSEVGKPMETHGNSSGKPQFPVSRCSKGVRQTRLSAFPSDVSHPGQRKEGQLRMVGTHQAAIHAKDLAEVRMNQPGFSDKLRVPSNQIQIVSLMLQYTEMGIYE